MIIQQSQPYMATQQQWFSDLDDQMLMVDDSSLNLLHSWDENHHPQAAIVLDQFSHQQQHHQMPLISVGANGERPGKLYKASGGSWASSCVMDQSGSSPAATILSFGSLEEPQPVAVLGRVKKPTFKEEAVDVSLTPQKRKFDGVVTGAPVAMKPDVARPPEAHKEHIMAERKRRQKLSQRFIALSKLVPHLNKMDKASILGGAIKYVEHLETMVKALEDQATKAEKKVVTAAAAAVDLSSGDGSSCDESITSSGQSKAALPEISVKIAGREILVKIYCENRKGTLIAALSAIDRLDDVAIANSSAVVFGGSWLDITVAATAGEGFSKSVKELVDYLNLTLKPFNN